MYKNKISEIDALNSAISDFRPLKKRELEELKEYYRIGLTYTSNALEGNSLTETETKIVLEEGITIGGKRLRDHLEAVGHSAAYDYMYVLARHAEIQQKDVCELHKLFYQKIDAQSAGKFRKEQVFITGTDFIPPPPSHIPDLMQQFFEKLPQLKKQLHPVEYAAQLHLNLVTIHPFVDGIGRTARLLMNVALMQAGYVITLIPAIVRSDYIAALKIAQSANDPAPFVKFISTMVYESSTEYLRLVRALRES